MQHMLLVWHACTTVLATAGCRLERHDWQAKLLFSTKRQHMQPESNEPLLTSSRECGQDKSAGNENRTRASKLQHNDQMRL